MEPITAAYLILQEIISRTETQTLSKLYPDNGPLRRELYIKHLAMFKAGSIHNERACLGGNRVGKSYSIGAYETALHCTGEYPDWWEGKRYTKPIIAWAAGTKGLKVRDVNQKFLIGTLRKAGGLTIASGGFVPKARIQRVMRKTSVPDAIETVIIRHKLGHENTLAFKSYEEGRSAFEAEGIDWIWLDEEPSIDIYEECLLRLLTTRGSILSTFTPVEGLTECVIAMLKDSDYL